MSKSRSRLYESSSVREPARYMRRGVRVMPVPGLAGVRPALAATLACLCLACNAPASVAAPITQGGGSGGGDNGGPACNCGAPGTGDVAGGGGGGGGGNIRGGDGATTDTPAQAGASGAGGNGGAPGTGTSGGGGGGGSVSGAPLANGGVGGSGVEPGSTPYTVSSGQTLTGAAGGQAVNGIDGRPGGGGGGGGALVLAPEGQLTNGGAIVGGVGGSAGINELGVLDGGGGGGGAGVVLMGAGSITNSQLGAIRGGQGGAGSYAGDGGAGVFLVNGGTLMNATQAAITGGTGGEATRKSGGGAAGVLANNGAIVNEGTITGGDSGTSGDLAAPAGGSGVQIDGGSVSNTGSISGGSGSSGGIGIIATGNVRIDNSGAIQGGLGSDGVTRADAIELSGGGNVLAITSQSAITGAVVSFGGDTLELTGTDAASFSMADVGFGSAYQGFSHLAKTGAGIWTLTGTDTLSLDWRIDGGTLNGSTDSIKGNVVNDAQLTFDQDQNGVYAGVISGAGSVTKAGAGTLTLTGNNTYTGGTVISAGILQVGTGGNSGALAGNVLNDGALIFMRSGTLTYDSVIAGTGSVYQTGSGTLVLNGVNTDTGPTTVSAGKLVIGGDAGHAAASVAGDVVVQNGGALGGIGTIGGSLQLDGNAHLAPGNSIGTLTVNGDLTASAGSAFDMELGTPGADFSTNGQGDSVAVGGNVAFNGAVLNIIDAGGMGPGVYNLFNYGGALNAGDLTLGQTPAGSTLALQFLTADGRINVLDTSGVTLDFWNANGSASPTQTGGGSGIWSNDSKVWTDANGSVTLAMQPQPGFAIFGGAPGTVTVSGAAGAVTATGLQFTSDGYTLMGDALTLRADATHPAPVEVRVGDGSAGSAAWTATIANTLEGSDGLSKTGAGTLVLTGNNTYSGGTRVQAGVLSVGSDANLGAAGGSLDLDGGTLRVTGTAYTGTSRAIVIDSASAIDIADGGNTFTLDQAISGSGALIKAGAGALELDGDSSDFNGAHFLAAGSLVVNGTLGGSLSALAGTTLAGTGTVGSTSLADGATIAPGNSAKPGTLTVNGNLQFGTGSVYAVKADPAGDSDLIHVTGTASLAGTVRQIAATDSSYAPFTRYTILQADGGVEGTFDSVQSDYAFLTPDLVYQPHQVTLELQRNDVRFVSLAQTGNQRAAAGALDTLAQQSGLYRAVIQLPAGQVPVAFDALSGEVHASTATILHGISDQATSLPLAHLRANLDAPPSPGAATAQLGAGDGSSLPGSGARPVWAEVFGNWRTLGSTANTAKVDESDGGLSIGGDHGVGQGWRVGGALGYTSSYSSIDGRSSRTDVDSYSATVFAGKAYAVGSGKINVMAGTAYTWHDIDASRAVDVAGLNQTLKSGYGASTGQFFTELGYQLPWGESAVIEPFTGVAYNDTRTRGFSESGGSAALAGDSARSDVTTTTLGLRARRDFQLDRMQGKVWGAAGWRHAFGDVNPDVTMAFDGSQSFTVAGAPIARDAAIAQVGVDVAIGKNTTAGISYSGEFGGGNQQNSGSVNVSWRF